MNYSRKLSQAKKAEYLKRWNSLSKEQKAKYRYRLQKLVEAKSGGMSKAQKAKYLILKKYLVR